MQNAKDSKRGELPARQVKFLLEKDHSVWTLKHKFYFPSQRGGKDIAGNGASLCQCVEPERPKPVPGTKNDSVSAAGVERQGEIRANKEGGLGSD